MSGWIRSAPGKIIAGQAIVTLVAAAVAGLSAGRDASLGALAGGGISILLTAWTALRMFSVRPEAGAQAMLSAFVRAEAIKIVMAVVLFSAAAIFLSHVYLPLVITFVATLTVNWFALLFTRHDPAGWGR
jgi:ATP synthase protein I